VKSLVALTTLFLLVLSVGCSARSPNVSGIPVEKFSSQDRHVAQPLTALDNEAAQLAVEFWKPTKIGKSYYFCYLQTSQDPECPSKGRTIIELRNVSVEVNPWTVTEADQLNGVEWNGTVTLYSGLLRFYTLSKLPSARAPISGGGYNPPLEPDKTWSPWRDNAPKETLGGGRVGGERLIVPLERAKGKWTIGKPPNLTVDSVWEHNSTFERVTPSEIPK
jgi:hypothetical protein